MEDEILPSLPIEEPVKPAPAKRGRPRKTKAASEDESTMPKAPAKRGRKPKARAEESELPAPEEALPEAPKKTPAKSKPLFSFDPDDEIVPERDVPAEKSSEKPVTETPAPLLVGDARPQLSPERPIAALTENVYSPEDDDAESPETPTEKSENAETGIADSEAASPAQEADGDADSRGASRGAFVGRSERWEKRQTQKFNPQDRGSRPQSGTFRPSGGNASAPQKEFKSRFQPQAKKEKFQGGKFNAQGRFDKFKERPANAKSAWGALANTDSSEVGALDIGNSFDYNKLKDETFLADLEAKARHTVKAVREMPEASPEDAQETPPKPVEKLVPCTPGEILNFNEIYALPMNELIALAGKFDVPVFRNPQRRPLIRKILAAAFEANRPIVLSGTLELLANGNGLLLYTEDNFCVRELSAFVPAVFIRKYSLQRGHELSTVVHPPMPGETAPIVVAVSSIMGTPPEEIKHLTPFTELTPYYPTERIMLEMEPDATNNLSMRCVDLLCPIGLGQRGLIVAPPRVGKTILLQTIANSISKNKPNAKLIVLLVDERPEEVTDFKRNTPGAEVVSSTFDEAAENHVHVAEMVIERARRMVELGMDVIILLDSITRLARAYNTLQPSGGKLLSGGIEAGALSKPKRFFGSARNIEEGGSLTILGTALIGTGSTMDEVIFEEFKGTGNMELDLDRDLANKRIFPAINFERSGTRKEELLYHPQEMQCVYSMRRAMKGMPSIDAMEMLISRMKKTKTNAEFLMTLVGR